MSSEISMEFILNENEDIDMGDEPEEEEENTTKPVGDDDDTEDEM